MMAGELRGLGPQGGRVLVHVLSVAGFTVVVAAIYLVIVLGIGHGPAETRRTARCSGLSMLAAAMAAIGYLPARDRLAAVRHPLRLRGQGGAGRGAAHVRQPPDPRHPHGRAAAAAGRVAAQDDGPDQRRGLHRQPATCWSARRGARHRAPVAGASRARERPVVGRAGVVRQRLGLGLAARAAGRAGPGPAPGGAGQPRRRAARADRGRSGRPTADAFTEEDDRVLTELARQVGLALHNVQLDTALQTTLDELRKQADELRESRARIVASGDAERRRVERNLHDGAQQHLVALAVNLRLARDIVDRRPGRRGARCSTSWPIDVKDTIQELRDLAHGIYPPLLADSGLGEALRAAAEPQPAAGRRVEADGDRPVPARGRGGRLLLLPGGAAERRQARAAAPRSRSGSGRRRAACCSRSATTAPASTRRAARARPRLRQHGRPAGRDRRHGALGVSSPARARRSAARSRSPDARPPSARPASRQPGRSPRVALVPQLAQRVGGQLLLVHVRRARRWPRPPAAGRSAS